MKITFCSTLAMLSAAVLAAPVQQRDRVTSKDDYQGCDKRFHGNGGRGCKSPTTPPKIQVRSEEPRTADAPKTVNAPRDMYSGGCVRLYGQATTYGCKGDGVPPEIRVRSEEPRTADSPNAANAPRDIILNRNDFQCVGQGSSGGSTSGSGSCRPNPPAV